jgi:hypothetical protein
MEPAGVTRASKRKLWTGRILAAVAMVFDLAEKIKEKRNK